jgi:hypothetical protein
MGASFFMTDPKSNGINAIKDPLPVLKGGLPLSILGWPFHPQKNDLGGN